MKFLFILLILIGCTGQQIKNKAPKRPESRKYYRFSAEQGILYNRTCKYIRTPVNKDCTDLKKDTRDPEVWKFFKNADFIIIPYHMIF